MEYKLINDKENKIWILFKRSEDEIFNGVFISNSVKEILNGRVVNRYKWLGDISKDKESILDIDLDQE